MLRSLKLQFSQVDDGECFLRQTSHDGITNMKIPVTACSCGKRINSVTTAWGDDANDGREPDNYGELVPNEEIVVVHEPKNTKPKKRRLALKADK
jgi:hypothetical protein